VDLKNWERSGVKWIAMDQNEGGEIQDEFNCPIDWASSSC